MEIPSTKCLLSKARLQTVFLYLQLIISSCWRAKNYNLKHQMNILHALGVQSSLRSCECHRIGTESLGAGNDVQFNTPSFTGKVSLRDCEFCVQGQTPD